MGKSGGRRKKSATANGTVANPATAAVHPAPPTPTAPAAPAATANGTDGSGDPSVFLKRALELKDEGNARFQAKDYAAAMELYNQALKLTPRSHPERAVFHSNRAACLLQMRPVDHEAVAAECSLALQSQPRHPRALLRRGRALEALRRFDLALQDALSLLSLDPQNPDALDLARRLRLQTLNQSQQTVDPLSRPSPAALGASAVRGAPSGLGPSLPSRPLPKKSSTSPPPPSFKPALPEKQPPLPTPSNPLPNGPRADSKPTEKSKPIPSVVSTSPPAVPVKYRPLKLVYDHDIRLAQMPANCSFRILREIVGKRFPSSKSVLIKYKDSDGDLVTVTSTAELRLAEEIVDGEGGEEEGRLKVLRLHVVEVSAEQEPEVVEEEEKPAAAEEEWLMVKGEDSGSRSSAGDEAVEAVESEIKSGEEEEVMEEKEDGGKKVGCDHAECKEVEVDDWLFEFAQLFRQQVGIDPDAHLDLHELGMELCSEALEEVVTGEEAQGLFEMAAVKFQEVAALAFFNWGNVHMCAARKKIPLDEASPKEVMAAQLSDAYDWVRERYALAGGKYEEALRIKPDFYEGLLALGQQHFETAKLHWSFTLANKVDLTLWDSSETIKLFDDAEQKMKAATEMWEKVEEQRISELKEPSTSKKEELLRKRKKQGDGAHGELSAEEAAEQASVMRSQIHLFWGNMLFERSQVEYKLGFAGWKKNLDVAVERFKLAGASEVDISVVLKNHASNVTNAECDEKKVTSMSAEISEVNVNDEDKHVLEK